MSEKCVSAVHNETGSSLKEPLFSICIACYNGANRIVKLLQSIVNQNFSDYEVIIVDDASSDDSVPIINEFISAHLHTRMKLIASDTNHGIIYTKSKAIQNAVGVYVMLCDQDDWMDSGCLDALSQMVTDNVDRVIAQYRLVDEDGNELRTIDIPGKSSKWLHTVWHGGVFRRSLFEGKLDDINSSFMSDDYYLIMNYNLNATNIKYLRETNYNNLQHTESTSSQTVYEGGIGWNPVENFRQIVGLSSDVAAKVNSNAERSIIEYGVVKFYYQTLMIIAHDCNPSKVIELYKILRTIIQGTYPDYLNNHNIKLLRSNGDRKYGRCGTYLLKCFEVVGLLPSILVIYRKLRLTLLIKGKE